MKGTALLVQCLKMDMPSTVFDLTPDLSSACSSHFNLIKTGNLRAEFGFETALPSTTNVIIFAEFDNIIEITKNRDVIYDFQN